jgi:hypothetical protein
MNAGSDWLNNGALPTLKPRKRGLKLDMDKPADREKLRRAVLDLVAGRKCQSKNGLVEILWFSFWQAGLFAVGISR